jgi:phosphate starvation-inducible protein PhoH and related proteins
MARNKYPQDAKAEGGAKIKIRQPLVPQNFAQELYIESLRNKPVTISNGPAGSGKTYLVTGVALEKLLSNQVDKIVFTRPVVEADEELGFLPGTLEQKLDPYLKPLFDAVEDHIGPTMAKKILESGKIEIAPLAYMRGRTFNYAYVVLDEAQNSTAKQMKMFLTRMGRKSFFSINGDVSQSDLTVPRDVPKDQWEHGLAYAVRKLTGKTENISYIEFHHKDVVRSDMCREIVTLLDSPDDRRVPSIDKHETKPRTRHSFSEPALFTAEASD